MYDPVYRKRFQPWETLARRLTADFKFATQGLTFLAEYRELVRALRHMPDYRRLSETSEAYAVPGPSFVFNMRHSRLGNLALRTAISVFSGSPDFSIEVYLPANQPTVDIFHQDVQVYFDSRIIVIGAGYLRGIKVGIVYDKSYIQAVRIPTES